MHAMHAVLPAIESSFRKIGQMISILSLTEDKYNLLMWSHYACEHRGFVIGINSSDHSINLKNSDEDDLRHPRKVIYSRDRPIIQLGRGTISDSAVNSFFFNKSLEWSYEKEWRVVFFNNKADRKIETPIGMVLLYKLSPSAIEEITIGARTSNEVAMKIIIIIATDPRYSHVKLYKSRISREKFGIEIIEIDTSSSAENIIYKAFHEENDLIKKNMHEIFNRNIQKMPPIKFL